MSVSCCRQDCPFAEVTCRHDVVFGDCTAYSRAKHVLREVFKHEKFRSGQLEVIIPALHKRDVIAKMATGSGKSLCFFLVPLAIDPRSVGVIISPLKGLMDQQVMQLHDIGVTAIHVNGGDNFEAAATGQFRFVLMSPESAISLPWRNIFQSPYFEENLALVAIDEAHCIPEWGTDFRTAFSKLGGLRALTSAPFMAVTASAPPHIEAQISSSLHLNTPVIVKQPLDRPNIYLSTSRSMGIKRDFGELAHLLASEDDLSCIPKTIVFSHTKDDVYKVYRFLRDSALQKHSVSMYHASQTEEARSFFQTTFRSSLTELRCLCATVAFGMGMDIPDIELVVVNGLPATVAQLYQMFGRAGRNGCSARAHLLYTSTEMKQISNPLSFLCIENKENCRRLGLLRALGSNETVKTNPACCDVCTAGEVPHPKLDLLVATSLKRTRKPKAIRLIDADMKETLTKALLEEREKIIAECPGYRLLGSNFVLSTSTIKELCSMAPYITLKDELKEALSLRPELYDRVFDILWNVMSCAPTLKKKDQNLNNVFNNCSFVFSSYVIQIQQDWPCNSFRVTYL